MGRRCRSDCLLTFSGVSAGSWAWRQREREAGPAVCSAGSRAGASLPPQGLGRGGEIGRILALSRSWGWV